MHEDQIEQIKNSIRELMQLLVQRGEPLSDEIKLRLAQVMEHAANRITQLRQEQETARQPPPEQPQIPNAPILPPGVDLLWILAGSQPDAFVNYLRTFPDEGFNALLRNPTQLTQVIEHLQRTMPPGQLGNVQGIEQAPLNSSNIYGFRYDPKSGRLLVRFQSGSIYGYDGVPPAVFQIFQQGAVPAKTNGQNKFGRWWQGKIPSLGAAFYNLIRQGNYPYQRLQ